MQLKNVIGYIATPQLVCAVDSKNNMLPGVEAQLPTIALLAALISHIYLIRYEKLSSNVACISGLQPH
jgi:uncharacterized membrane protein (GlpM family)